MKRVAVLVHPALPLKAPYCLSRIVDRWRSEGRDVAVVDRPEDLGDAELVVPHLPLTTRPKDVHEALLRRPGVLNARVSDISKRRISRLAVGASYDGPVILKSNLNAHGSVEAFLGTAANLDYRVYESAAELPREAFDHPDLIVERFEPELEDGLFWLRTWDFLGDREIGFRYSSGHPVARGDRLVWRETLAEVPDDLRRARAELGFDYGSFDYGVAGDSVFLYDVNITPVFPRSLPAERADALVDALAAGLGAFR